MSGPIVLAVSYVLLAVFAVAFVARSVRLARLPLHLRWELAPVPHERGKSRYGGSYFEEFEWWTRPREVSLVSELVYMIQEIVFLKAVWEHNRRLWWFSFPLHVGLYLLGLTALLLVGTAGLELLGASAATWPVLRVASGAAAGVGCAFGLIGAVGLLGKRLLDRQLADLTAPASVFNLALLLALFVSGGFAFITTPYAPDLVSYVRKLCTADATAALPGALAWHVAVALAFLAYLPFTRMMHFVAKYFTYHEVRWDDRPMVAGSRMEREIQALLGQPVSWAAEHLNADGRKTWVDLATEETTR
jgi:nitrate reductase gamma subunit